MKESLASFGSDQRLAGGGLFVDLFPKLLLVVGVLVDNIGIDVQRESCCRGKVKRRQRVSDGPDLTVVHTAEPPGVHAHPFTVGELCCEPSCEESGLHIQLTVEILHFAPGQVELLMVDGNMDPYP